MYDGPMYDGPMYDGPLLIWWQQFLPMLCYMSNFIFFSNHLICKEYFHWYN